MERVSITEARAATGEVRGTLAVLGSRCPRRTALRLCALIERLADALDDAQREMRRRDDLTTPYATLVEEWNALVAGLRDLGVVISQPAPGPAWRWGWGGQSGEAPTMAAAYLAALRSAGLGRPMETMIATERDEAAQACRRAFLDWYGGVGAHETLTMRVSQAPEGDEWRVEFSVTAESKLDYGWWGYVARRSQDAADRCVADGWHCERMDEGDSLLSGADEWREELCTQP